MARKPKAEAKEASPDSQRHKDLLKKLREHYKLCVEADHDNRTQAMEDLKFMNTPGAQTDEKVKRKRGNRPNYEYNLSNVRAKRVINDMRANRAQGKVRAVEDGDKDTAEIREGLIRNIANVSDFDSVTDYAAEYQVGGGMGAWRVVTEYSADTTFDQDVFFRSIRNPFCLWADPAATDMMKRDASYWILEDRVSKATAERRWPGKNVANFEESDFDDDQDWMDETTVRICEYWYKVPVSKEIALLADGRTVEMKDVPPGEKPVRTRTVNSFKIKMCIASGAAILEEQDWPGDLFPFVQVYGCWLVIDGKVMWYGIIRNGKDAQRALNVMNTAAVETVMSAPQAKFWATAKQAEGHVDKWSTAHDENIPAMLYNADPQAGGPPQRMGGADVPAALLQMAAMSEQMLNATMGVHEASLGEQGDEKSGRAITARQRQGEITNFNFSDNMAKGIKLTWEIADNLIGKLYTNERSVRILGADGAEKYERVNYTKLDPQTLQMVPVNDLTRGKYDTTITVGPSFATRRQEAVEAFVGLAAQDELLMPTAGDLVYQAMDLPYAEQIAERRKAMLPPQIQQQLTQGKPLPPEVQAAMGQVQQMQAQVEEQAAMAQQVGQEAQKEKSAADKAKADVQVQQANLKVLEANLEVKVAQFEKLVAQTQANMAQQAAQESGESAETEKQTMLQAMSEQVAAAVEGILAQGQQLLQAYAEQMQAIPQVVMQANEQQAAAKPQRVGRTIKTQRGPKGQLVAQVDSQFSDGTTQTRNVNFTRGPNGLEGQETLQ